MLTDLFLNVCSLVWRRSGQDAGVGEAGLEQGDDHKHKEASSNDRYAAGQVFDQEGTAVTDRGEDELPRQSDHIKGCKRSEFTPRLIHLSLFFQPPGDLV